jgi:hypothetical protein
MERAWRRVDREGRRWFGLRRGGEKCNMTPQYYIAIPLFHEKVGVKKCRDRRIAFLRNRLRLPRRDTLGVVQKTVFSGISTDEVRALNGLRAFDLGADLCGNQLVPRETLVAEHL